ncbi:MULTISPECIES: WXG100 family type VII secretion target [unclassified Nocardia]|uniref:WXG100 family type VII secretion target n=1 Tax=unclassified Nocardia TaxID=2637762 RepID=UPI001CE3DAB8|nr:MULTISPECIES: type VII secretion target [unclassified Nocardia]
MAEKLEVTTHELRGVADDLDEVAGRVQGVLDTLAQARDAHWGAWGDDDFGKNFSGGKGYIASDTNLDSAVGSKVQLLQSYSGGLRDGADALDKQESDNTDGFQA